MAETVKKSRIVSDEDENLEEALIEEFNMRLKNCMSNDDLQSAVAEEEAAQEEEQQNITEHIYENLYLTSSTPSPPTSTKIASNDFILNERENYYDTPRVLSVKKNGHSPVMNQGVNHELLAEELDKTEIADQTQQIQMETSPKIEIEHINHSDCELNTTGSDPNDCSYEFVEPEDVEQPVQDEGVKSVKDRMFLATDDAAATLLFTQTVTSPMLTPSEENIDFLKGFQTEITTTTTTTTTTSSETPVEKTSEDNSTASDPLAEENIYENAEFLKHRSENIYENLKDIQKEEAVYHNVSSEPEPMEEHIYQDIEDCREEVEALYESLDEVNQQKTMMIENSLYDKLEEFRKSEPTTDLDQQEENNTNYEVIKTIETSAVGESHERIVEEISNFIKHESNPHVTESNAHIAESNTQVTESNTVTTKESYSEFIHHSKTESNYYEKYTEVLSKSTDIITNKEKDTETVPPEIVKNLKNQFSKVEVVGATTKKEMAESPKAVNIMKQINKFEQKDSPDGSENKDDDSTVTESYTETTIQSTEGMSEKGIKKKKTKKSRKEEKENISVKSSFNKFDALQKKNLLHIRSSDSAKAQEKFNGAQQMDTTNCKACSKQVFQMEQIKAEKAIWHKNCFRCTACSKQLTVETYASHEGNLYCKPHFKSLFAPKAVEDETPQRPRKPELIIRENQPLELPPDVVRASDKPDLGLEELQSLNMKERFEVFEHHQTESQERDRGTNPVNVKRSPSILSKLARFQAKGMDVGVPDDALNGIPIEESSSEEEEEEEEVPEGEDPTLYKARRAQKEKPFHFTNLNEVKNKWEHGEKNAREERREERKQEIQSFRNKLFMGKQGKMKEAYQQAVMQSESCANLNKTEKIESCDTKSLKERFEKGELYNEKSEKGENDEESEVFQSEISKKSRSLFLELDANASKPPQISPITPPKVDVRKARESFLAKMASEDTVKSSEIEDVIEVKTADIQERFKFFETYKEPQKTRKQFRITPPRDPSQVKTETPEREIYHDPDVVRAEDYIDDSVIAKTTHTASKMLNKFRQMEENLTREPEQVGPKPLKRFTPPPEPARPESSSGEEESGSEEETEEEDQPDNQKLPEDLIEAQKAARAKQLRAKFEKWEAQEIKREQSQAVNVVEEYGDDSQVESTKALRARFEQLRDSSTETTKAPRVKVNRFV